MNKLSVSENLITQTLRLLQEGGARGCETVVLWLGRSDDVVEAYRPQQIVDKDFFRLPAESMRALMGHLRSSHHRVLAQVHSHPYEAFHSRADDEWAIVRHEGALSLVIPEFAARTTAESFFEDAVTFRLSATDRWERVKIRDWLHVEG